MHFYAHHTARGRRGFTLMETAIVLGIAALLAAGVWGILPSIQEESRVTEAVAELTRVAQSAVALSAGGNIVQAPFGGVIVLNALLTPAAGAIAASTPVLESGDVWWPPSPAATPWGTAFRAYAMGTRALRISFYTIPNDGCIALLMQATRCNPSPDCPVDVITNFALNQYPPAGTTKTVRDMTITDATAMCAANSPLSNSVEFDYNL